MDRLPRIVSSVALAWCTAVGFVGQSNAFSFKDAPLLLQSSNMAWTGYYGGANAGYAWGTEEIDLASTPGSTLQNAINAHAIPPSPANAPKGYLAGFQVGYNYQLDQSHAVFGVEADYQLANILDGKSQTQPTPGFARYTTVVEQKLQSLASLRARLGIAPSETLLLYLTGGLAYGHEQLSGSISNPGCAAFCGSNSSTYNSLGWITGAGVEYAFMTDWSVKAEYLYYNLGGQSQRITDPALPGTYLSEKVEFDGNLIRVGLNYKFL